MTNESVSKLEWLAGLRGVDLTHAEFRVLVTLFTYTDASLSNAYPSKATLAEVAKVTPRTLTTSLRTLQKKGLARIVRQGGNQYGKGTANVWELLPHSYPKGVTEGSPSARPKGIPDIPPSRGEGGPSVPVKGVPEYRSRGSLSDPSSGHRSGHRSGGARADDSQPRETSIAPPPRRCPRHIHDDIPPNCHACGQARRAHESWQSEQQRADRQAVSDAARARAEDRARALAACGLCDETGYRNGRPCDHNPNQDETNARGREKAWAAIGGRKPR
ncbi:hypothetical protein GS448_15855 [Rhodococcus hoagii]|nr:hypothetical protein [Prescottella equi]MBM4668523.1 hypothetical protein [Prescottella equi]NKV88746.1 hypothetical protein [Prescottella equi]